MIKFIFSFEEDIVRITYQNKINYTPISFDILFPIPIFIKIETLIFFKAVLLKDLLKSKGIKQNWLANRMGVSEVTLSNWVKHKSIPTKKHLDKLGELLNVSVAELTN